MVGVFANFGIPADDLQEDVSISTQYLVVSMHFNLQGGLSLSFLIPFLFPVPFPSSKKGFIFVSLLDSDYF